MLGNFIGSMVLHVGEGWLRFYAFIKHLICLKEIAQNHFEPFW